MGIWSLVTGGITSLVGGYFENKKEKQQQTHTQKMSVISGKQDWETTSLSQMAASLKDEWWTFVFSLPLVAIFISPFADLFMSEDPYSKGMFMRAGLEGLAGLESAPTWYVTTLGVMIGASFGVKGYGQVMAKLKGGK